jgi:hypothetical protein
VYNLVLSSVPANVLEVWLSIIFMYVCTLTAPFLSWHAATCPFPYEFTLHSGDVEEEMMDLYVLRHAYLFIYLYPEWFDWRMRSVLRHHSLYIVINHFLLSRQSVYKRLISS